MTSAEQFSATQTNEAPSIGQDVKAPAPSELEELIEQFTPSKSLRRGEIIDGKVLSKATDGLVVNIGYKSEGIVPAREMRSLDEEAFGQLSIGDGVIAYVVTFSFTPSNGCPV